MELKHLEDTIERINRIEELETETIMSTKRNLIAIEKGKSIKMNKLEKDLRIKIVKQRKIKEKQ